MERLKPLLSLTFAACKSYEYLGCCNYSDFNGNVPDFFTDEWLDAHNWYLDPFWGVWRPPPEGGVMHSADMSEVVLPCIHIDVSDVTGYEFSGTDIHEGAGQRWLRRNSA